jgi:hypothetical protein
MLGDRNYVPHWVLGLLFGKALAREAKANLTPSRFSALRHGAKLPLARGVISGGSCSARIPRPLGTST